MENQLLSILIPTKNRQEYLIEVIRNILKIDNSKFELVIQDNSDAPKLQEILKQNYFYNDNRFKYYYCGDVLSFVDNFSLGISHCDGEYLILIGDDDTINPDIIQVVEWAKENNIDAITPTFPAVYYWPESGVNSKTDSGRFTLTNFNSQSKIFQTKKELKKLLRNGAQNYLYYNLVKAYHGIVKTSFLHDIKNITGYFIGGLSPDIYLSVALSLLVDKVMVIDYPLTISGICKKSGSADSATGRHTGNIEDAPHFRGHTNYEWSTQIPKFYSVETIWGDSALKAVTDINRSYLKYFNTEVIGAYCIKYHPHFKKVIYESLAENRGIKSNSILLKYLITKGLLLGPSKKFLIKVKRRLFNHKKIQIFDNIENINEAAELLNNQIKNNRIQI